MGSLGKSSGCWVHSVAGRQLSDYRYRAAVVKASSTRVSTPVGGHRGGPPGRRGTSCTAMLRGPVVADWWRAHELVREGRVEVRVPPPPRGSSSRRCAVEVRAHLAGSARGHRQRRPRAGSSGAWLGVARVARPSGQRQPANTPQVSAGLETVLAVAHHRRSGARSTGASCGWHETTRWRAGCRRASSWESTWAGVEALRGEPGR